MFKKKERLKKFLSQVVLERGLQEEQQFLLEGAGRISSSYWVDLPWRLEPDMTEIPFTIIIRDAEERKILVEEISIFSESDKTIPNFHQNIGEAIEEKTWSYHLIMPLPASVINLDKFILFKINIKFSNLSGESWAERRCVQIFSAAEPLPLRSSNQWFYGDTHYHSIYTNDLKEFGNPVYETRTAAQCIGLDWLIITDHSVDLADNNPYWENKLTESRWNDLLSEVQKNSDNNFRILRGEEVSVKGKKTFLRWIGLHDDTLHLLVFGANFDKMIPGAWTDGRSFLIPGFEEDRYSHLFGRIYKLKNVLTGKPKDENLVGRSVKEQNALAFAAHPKCNAQLPGSQWGKDDLNQAIHGLEAWNSRKRLTCGKEECPFDQWKDDELTDKWEGGDDCKGIEEWDKLLRKKINLDNPRFVLLAGSDAHGSFNFSEGWALDWDFIKASDNALGKVRTLLYLPHFSPEDSRKVPTEKEIVETISKGSCVVTDGPVLNFCVRFNGKEAKMGDILSVNGDGTIEAVVEAAWTEEFGTVESVTATYFFKKGLKSAQGQVVVKRGDSKVLEDVLPSGPGYLRLETITHNDKDIFRCFTNPIWIKSTSTSKRKLRLFFQDQNLNNQK